MAINKSKLFNQAWQLARTAAKRNGGKAVEYLSASLKKAWASAKQLAANVQATIAKKNYSKQDDKDVMGQTLTFARLSNIQDSFYGQTAEFTFEDAKGNQLTWTTKLNGWLAAKLVAGKDYKLNFNFKNGDQTEMSYVTLAR